SILLIALLFEFNKLHAQLAASMEEVEARNHELIRSRDALVRAQRFEALGQLTGGIAHDFNNLLTAITGGLELIARRPADTERVLRLAGNASKAADRGSQLIRRLMSFARRQNLRPEVLDTNETLREFGSLATNVPGSRTTIRFELADVGTICVDETEFQAAFLNLVSNARDAVPDGHEIVVATRMVGLTKDQVADADAVPGRFVQVAVVDRGSGMAPDVQTRIFEPFFTTKEHGKGTGLGLSTVFGIVRQAGGTIWVYSEVARGTTFKVYLPRTDEAIREDAPGGELATLRGTETILLVEDDDQVRLVARGILRRSGYRVLEAQNGGEAIMTCEKHVGIIDLVLTDVVMPQMSGRELVGRLVTIRSDLRVLYMSGYTEDAILRHGIVDAGVELLQKPLTPSALLRKVRAVLDRT
nr:ATP-binding protein [Kofleriaceae bacterium]